MGNLGNLARLPKSVTSLLNAVHVPLRAIVGATGGGVGKDSNLLRLWGCLIVDGRDLPPLTTTTMMANTEKLEKLLRGLSPMQLSLLLLNQALDRARRTGTEENRQLYMSEVRKFEREYPDDYKSVSHVFPMPW